MLSATALVESFTLLHLKFFRNIGIMSHHFTTRTCLFIWFAACCLGFKSIQYWSSGSNFGRGLKGKVYPSAINVVYMAVERGIGDVIIEAPSINSRRITSSILIDTSPDDVWEVLTDYNNLAKYVPNLTKSYVLPSSVGKGIRIFQEGAQKIIGFDFRASLSMEMTENDDDDEEFEMENRALRTKTLGFKLVDSSMFSSFDGEWSLKCHSRVKAYDYLRKENVFTYKTKLTYSVTVKPKGPVPVLALEWRIKEDVPINLMAMKIEAESRSRRNDIKQRLALFPKNRTVETVWESGETLGAYSTR